MKLYYSAQGIFVEADDHFYQLENTDWTTLINRDDLHQHLKQAIAVIQPLASKPDLQQLPPPVEQQEVWGSGVTYYRSRTARMEESEASGGDVFYDKVYDARRPEIFYKGSKRRAVGQGGTVTIRSDSHWNVPEPELTLFVTANQKIVAYTIGNDMSSRDIEGENPLYLPQAKVWTGSTALGPCLYVPEDGVLQTSEIKLEIVRSGKTVFQDETDTDQIKRELTELVDYLFFADDFPEGVFLMTGTGIIPEGDFSLQAGDEVHISIEHIGTLRNQVTVFQK